MLDKDVLELIITTDLPLTPKGILWKKLLKRCPKKYWNRIGDFYQEDGLIDGCKFMIEFAEPYVWGGDYHSLPVRSITEAVSFLKETWI